MRSKVINTKLSAISPNPVTKVTAQKWVNWGSRNDYPDQLASLYYNSPTHHSCVDFAVSSIIGDGIDYDAMQIDRSQIVPNYYQTWDNFLYNISIDYIIYGTFGFQIIKNNDGKTYSFYNYPISNIRCGERDEDGVITNYWICKDWKKYGQYPPKNVKAFGFQEDEKINKGEVYLYVHQAYSPFVEYYASPHYISGLKAIQTEIELINYDLRSTLNNFSASGILTANRIDSDEEREEFINNIEKIFTGSNNANSVVITFKDNDDDKPIDFTPIDKSSENVNLFGDTNERTIDRIVSTHKIQNKALIGYPTESASLGGDGNALNVAYNLYNKNFGNQNRNTIVGTINRMFKLNGIDIELILKPLTFGLTDTETIESKSTEDTTQDVSTDNIEEAKQ